MGKPIPEDEDREKMSYLSTGWTGDWRTLSISEMLDRAEMLESYYNGLPEGVTSEAWAEAQLIRREVSVRLADQGPFQYQLQVNFTARNGVEAKLLEALTVGMFAGTGEVKLFSMITEEAEDGKTTEESN